MQKEELELYFENIKTMVDRLRHIDECEGGENCKLTDDEIKAGLNIAAREKIDEEDRKEYHDRDLAIEAILQDPISIEVREDWHKPGAENVNEKYSILLAWGGPAIRIIGQLNEHKEPETARLEWQNWGTEWEGGDWFDESVLLDYARQFSFE